MKTPTTTISEEQTEQYAIEVQGLWYAYNLIGRGHVSEWDWGFAYMTGKLPQLIEQIVKEQENEKDNSNIIGDTYDVYTCRV